MKLYSKFIYAALAVSLFASGCTKNFADLNTNPESISEVDPQTLFYSSQTKVMTSGYLWNDVYASKLRWMQYTSNIWGYSTTNFSYFSSSIGDELYRNYNDMGSYTKNIAYAAKLSNQEDKYAGIIQMSRILLIAKGIQTADIYGSLAYSDAWRAREGDQNPDALTPKFESQEQLYTTWDSELKTAIEKLKAIPAGGFDVAAYDRAFKGNISSWIKSANALRLRVALRLWNRIPSKAKEIAAEVLSANNANFVPSTIDDSFVLWFPNDYTVLNGGDWHSIYDMDCASAPFMNYLKKYNDPRKGIFFLPNNLTPENIKAYNAQSNDKKVGYIDASGNVTDASRNISATMTRWEGGTVSFDRRNYDEPYLARTLAGSTSTNMRAMNYPQTKVWKGVGYDGKGSGGNFAPILTYADFCFMAAEFVFRENVASAHSAKDWYTNGVTASLKQWDKFGDYSRVDNYVKLTDNQITDFVNQSGVSWDPSKGLEQIYAQAFVEHFKNTNEAWAQWKRTGYPSQTSTIITWDKVLINKQEQRVPRKVKFGYPTVGTNNYENQKIRLDEMAKYPEFLSVDNEFGKLWSEK